MPSGGLFPFELIFKAATRMTARSITTKVASTVRRRGHVSSAFKSHKNKTRELQLKRELKSNCKIESDFDCTSWFWTDCFGFARSTLVMECICVTQYNVIRVGTPLEKNMKRRRNNSRQVAQQFGGISQQKTFLLGGPRFTLLVDLVVESPIWTRPAGS